MRAAASLFAALVAVASALTYRAADISSLIVVEDSGVEYSQNGVVIPFEDILVANGMNTARVRIWTAGQYNLTYALAMGKRVKDAGLTLHVDLHYSDTWADPGHQAIPSAWPTTLSRLNTQIYDYTQSVVQAFTDQGTPVDILQVGNEINNGLLWPVGEISVNGFDGLSQLLNSAIHGGLSAGSPKILVHLANGWDWSDLKYFWEGVFGIQGALTQSEVDIMGVSFYPFYGTNATLANLSSSLTNLVNEFDKPVVVAETNWPAVCSGVTLSEPEIPISAQGQEEWTGDIKSVLNGLPDGLGQGIYYWEPGWIGNAALGSSCSDNLLVDSSGAVRQSIDIFGDDM
ncbi:arabinogalactan endo-1,4-beta-galactosidase [Fomitopsis serialis]|uniref:arabinogalactan endo-1,4-beta-galactosidase n=1 Tax=Fomitopsis serialis TaxID=139415 RepID=UPI002007D17B|nr:arabinogalactan endo-1,4-beta-galactosidase [Neoantrodia serialis]KAH9937998.1 arabinogalactan endo-1,4-beta-galactosidase [Neoantrodia serialis]